MMAESEKALCDTLVTTRNLRIQSRKAMLSYLLEDLRLEEYSLTGLRIEQVEQHARAGFKSELLHHLATAIGFLTSDYARSDASHSNAADGSGLSLSRWHD